MPSAIGSEDNTPVMRSQGPDKVAVNGCSSRSDLAAITEVHQEYSSTGQWVAPSIEAPTASEASTQLFTAYLREFPRLSALDSFTWLTFHDESLVECMRTLFPAAGTLYDRQPSIDARDVYVKMDQLTNYYHGAASEARNAVQTLIDYLNRRFTYVSDTIATYPEGMLSWHLLWTLFKSGDELETAHDVSGEPLAIILDSWKYVQEAMGRFFVLSGYYFQWAGTTFHRIPLTRKVKEYSDLRSVVSLPTKPLTKQTRDCLIERGKQYLGRIKDCHVLYDGFFFTRAFSGATRLLGIGEVVIDVKSFRRFNPALDGWTDDVTAQRSANYGMPKPVTSEAVETFTEDAAFLLPPTLHGFSLRAKRWGEFLVNRLSTITWRDDAFSHLVIQPSYRRIIRALVTVHASELKQQLLTDVVEGKGNGLIMALHGSPGTGKTLTAEAIAEHLRRPLYIVSAGELGLTVQSLEKQLKDVLELAIQWNAVLLIDEADIFLEKRSLHQLERNALVGVFLRLLEYFTGVLILTTNSIESFDEAFLSRFAMCLHFKELDETARKTLWERFITKSGADVGDFDLNRLASFRLNGRDIKHTIQAAQAVALVEKEPLTMAHFEEVLALRRSGALIA